MTIDFRRQLNEQQFAAATGPDGPLLILAAAGTGKTRTIVYRVAYLLERGVPSDRILLLTFTNKAAREMLERARELAGHNVSGLWGGTFHHMANRVLRRHADGVGFSPDFTILDRDDSLSLIQSCVRELKSPSPEFPKPEVLMSLFSTSANTEKTVQSLAESRFQLHPVDQEQILAVHRAYQKRKRKINAMDFDDLLVFGLTLFRDHPDVLAIYQERFLHILVDEYQDTNAIQAEWVDLLAKRNRNLAVVGDDFQSIYAWRGANYRNIMSYPERFPDAKVFLLEHNYRSAPEILAVANAVIAGNPKQFQKTLRTTRESQTKPVVASMRDGEAQARYVVEQIHRLRRSGCRPSNIAVLYRAHYHSMELQMYLTKERLPYTITSGVRFFEQAHIKDACALVRVLANPEDEVSFARLLGLLPKVGPRTAERLWQKLGEMFVGSDPAQRHIVNEGLPAAARPAWKAIVPILEDYEAADLKSDPGEVIHRFLEAFYDEYAAHAFENAEHRTEDIRELVLFTANFETTEQFLSEIALLTNLDAEAEATADGAGESIRLSTVHQAKGLEWDAVILLWVTDGLFPPTRTLQESPEGEEEERRLFYVAVTRARDEVIFCVPEIRRTNDGGVRVHRPSRFLDEIPRHLLQEQRIGFI